MLLLDVFFVVTPIALVPVRFVGNRLPLLRISQTRFCVDRWNGGCLEVGVYLNVHGRRCLVKDRGGSFVIFFLGGVDDQPRHNVLEGAA